MSRFYKELIQWLNKAIQIANSKTDVKKHLSSIKKYMHKQNISEDDKRFYSASLKVFKRYHKAFEELAK